MKTKVISSFFAFTIAITALTLVAQRVSEGRKAELKVDSTPLSQEAGAVVVSYADVIEPVQKAVVSVYSSRTVRQTQQMNPLFREFFGNQLPERESVQRGMGSGVILTEDGYVITNNHVIEGADELKVLLPDEREFPATVIGTDPKTDIAIIKIEAEGLPTATLADSDLIRVGDVVFAVGNPLGVGQTVTMGIVSAKSRSVGILESVGGYEDFIQTDASINQGNSGGALVDAKGRLIGINSAILSPTRGNIGIGFAVPVNLAANIMRSLIDTGEVSRGYLGISVDPITAELAEALGIKKDTRGVMVVHVTDDSPAEKAGLQRSDVILSVNNRTVTSLQDLRLLISQMAPGTTVSLRIIREAQEMTIEAILETLPGEGPASNELLEGVVVTPLTDEVRSQLGIGDRRLNGLLVTNIAADSPYANRFAPNMLILEINGEPATDVASARAAFQEGRRNLVYVFYRGAVRSMVLVIP